jgi:hypothetical protein
MPPRKRKSSRANQLPGVRRKNLASRRRRNLRLENPGRSCRERRPLPAQPEEILFRVEGKMSTFGGPQDLGMADFAWQDGYAAFTSEPIAT